MKTVFNTIILVALLTLFGCSEKKSAIVDNPPDNSSGYFAEGIIVAEFVDTLLPVNAESFLRARGLTVYTLYDFDEVPPYSYIIDVPIGQEEAWADTLRKYPEIKLAGRIAVTHTSN